MDYNLSTSLNNHQVYQEMIMDQESLNQQQDEQRPTEIGQPPPPRPPPPPPAQKCPRCDSSNTKFCYYNNYSLSQPRYYCKSCRRYWTHGGTLRNVPVGGGSRKNKRSKTTSSSSSSCSHEINVRSQTSSAAVPSHNLTACLISGQQLSPFPPAVPPMVTGGAFLSSLAATAAMNSRFGANMTLLQRIGIPLRPHEAPPPPHQFQPSQRSLVPPRPSSSWTQSSFYNGGGSSFWSSNTTAGADGRTQPAVSSSFSPNEWSYNHPGFHPPQ